MTKIPWAEKTWNPIVGCTKVSPGCENCYAERQAASGRLQQFKKYQEVITDGRWNGSTYLSKHELDKPLGWKKPCPIFVCSMSDLFHPTVADTELFQVLTIAINATKHTFLFLTKRPDRMAECMEKIYLTQNTKQIPANWWLGVTAENQEQADRRIPILLQIPAAVRFVSVEPMLERVDLRWVRHGGNILDSLTPRSTKGPAVFCNALDWVICGAESGPNRRPMEMQWARNLKDQCVQAGVPFFFKQAFINGKKIEMPELDEQEWNQRPERIGR